MAHTQDASAGAGGFLFLLVFVILTLLLLLSSDDRFYETINNPLNHQPHTTKESDQ